MVAEQEPYLDVRRRLTALGCVRPRSVAILPTNLHSASSATDFVFPFSTLTVKKLLTSAQFALEDVLPDDLSGQYKHDRAGDWILPTLFVTTDWLAQHPDGLKALLTIILDYAKHVYRAMPSPRVTLSIVREHQDGTCTKVSYNGAVEGLSDLPPIVQSISGPEQENVTK